MGVVKNRHSSLASSNLPHQTFCNINLKIKWNEIKDIMNGYSTTLYFAMLYTTLHNDMNMLGKRIIYKYPIWTSSTLLLDLSVDDLLYRIYACFNSIIDYNKCLLRVLFQLCWQLSNFSENKHNYFRDNRFSFWKWEMNGNWFFKKISSFVKSIVVWLSKFLFHLEIELFFMREPLCNPFLNLSNVLIFSL